MHNSVKKQLPKKKSKLLRAPFWKVGGYLTCGFVFIPIHKFNYKQMLGFNVFNPKWKWEYISNMPLVEFLKFGEPEISVILYGEKSIYWNKFSEKKDWLDKGLRHHENGSFVYMLKRIQSKLKNLGFTEKNGPFMAMDIKKLKETKIKLKAA